MTESEKNIMIERQSRRIAELERAMRTVREEAKNAQSIGLRSALAMIKTEADKLLAKTEAKK